MRRNWRMMGLLILVALVFSACQPIVAEPQAQTSDEDVAAAVNALWDEYEASQMAGDPDRWIALWTDDGVKMPPDEPAIEGTDQIFARAQRSMADPIDEMVITALETQSAGDWAYSRGVFTVTFPVAETGEQELMDGKFMTILRRQPDGSWKIHRDIHNWNGPPAPVAESATDVEAVSEAINSVWREYEASILAGDPERWIQLWEEDGVQLPPGVPPVVGKEAIFPRISNDLATFDYSEFVITNEDVEVNGDLAFARGNYVVSFTPKAGGEPMDLNGKYMTIFHQQADGSWKIYRDIFNSSGAAGEEQAAATDVEAVTAEIDAFWRDYERTMLAGDSTHCDELWMEAGAQLPADLSADVLESVSFPSLASDPAQLDFSEFVINNEALELHEDWAVARGTYVAQCTPKGAGDLIELEGEYLTIFVQGPDGSWQLYQDLLN